GGMANLPQSGSISWILCSRQNPKILGRDDAEVVRHGIAVGVPVPWHLLAQERQDGAAEVSKGLVTSVVCDVIVHQPPRPLDRVQMRAVGRDEVKLDPTPRPRQPSLHQFGVMIPGV